MILLAGGTGLLGSAIATRLLDQGRPVRALVRSAERAAALRQRGAEIAVGDLRDGPSLGAACRGATHVITTANAFMGRGSESVAAVELPVAMVRVLGTLLRPFNPVLARQMSAGALMGSGPQPFDPGPMLERYPVTLMTLEGRVRARYRQSAPSA